MSKGTTNEKAALAAIDEAREAAKTAKRTAKGLPDAVSKKTVSTLTDLAVEAKEIAGTSAKKVRKHPTRVARQADAVTAAVRKAVKRAEKAADKALEAERAAAEAKEAARAAKKAAKAARAQAEAAEADERRKAVKKAAKAAKKKAETVARKPARSAEPDVIVIPHVEHVDDDSPEIQAGVSEASSPDAAEAPASGSGGDLEALTVVRLRALARERGLTGYSRLTKAQLVALLER